MATREIKFKAWNSLTKEMGQTFTLQAAIGSRKVDGVNTNGIIYMQYTGLKDKNGAEIYERDILEIDTHHDLSTYRDEVVFAEGAFSPVAMFPTHSECAVIGNIYENPELLT